MRKTKDQPIPGHDEGARLTPAEAGAIVRSWGISEDHEAAEFLLLVRSICYERDLMARENIVMAIEDELTTSAPCARKALDKVALDRLAVAHSLLKEGGSQ
jgi:hypothetical protein